MPTFQPPSAETHPRVFPKGTPGQDPIAHDLMRHYHLVETGRSVLKIDGTYQTIDYPTQDQIDSATEVYLGGHIYEVSSATATALTTAGYGSNIT